jgi:hypothetical protein
MFNGYGQLVEWELAGETEVFLEYLPQHHIVHNKSHMTLPGIEPGSPRQFSVLLTCKYAQFSSAHKRTFPYNKPLIFCKFWYEGFLRNVSLPIWMLAMLNGYKTHFT